MCICLKCPAWSKSLLIFTLGFSSLWLALRFNGALAMETAAFLEQSNKTTVSGKALELIFSGVMISQANPLELRNNSDVCSKENGLSFSKTAIRKIKVVLTAYSSTVGQTDSTPFITANGTYVHDGVVANNGLPFGTKIRIPELYGSKEFSVEDRMHWRMGDYRFDIWFPSYEQAKNFGVRYAYVEVLEK